MEQNKQLNKVQKAIGLMYDRKLNEFQNWQEIYQFFKSKYNQATDQIQFSEKELAILILKGK